MKKFTTILCSLCTGLIIYAQPGIIGTRPANGQDGKILDMQETIMSRSLLLKTCTAAGSETTRW